MFMKWTLSKLHEPRLYCRVYLLSISEMQGMLMEFSPVSTAIFWLNLLWRDIYIRLLENELGEVTLTLGRFLFPSWLYWQFFYSSVSKVSFLCFRDTGRKAYIIKGELKILYKYLVILQNEYITVYSWHSCAR